MHISIDASVAVGLHVIPEIPDLPLCRLEGRNGVGKTVAIRLLQLVTGDQPWAGLELAWDTLRAGLGPTTITVTGLRGVDASLAHDEAQGSGPTGVAGNSQLVWRLVPSDWPDEPQERGPWTIAELDGRPVDIEEIRLLLRVFRIAGDESLAQSLAGQVQVDRQRLRVAMARADARRRRWDQRLEDFVAATGSATPTSIREHEENLHRSEANLTTLQDQLASERQMRDQVRQVVELLEHTERLEQRLPELNEQLEALKESEDSLRSQLGLLDEQASEVRSEADRSQEVLAELEGQESLFQKRRNRLARRTRAVAELTRELGLPEPPEEAELQHTMEETENQLQSAISRRRTHDRAGLLVELTEDLTVPLSRTIDDGLGDEIVADMSGRQYSVRDLHKGVETRHNILIEDVGAEGQLLQDEIDGLEQQHFLLSQLTDEQRLLRGAEHDLQEVEGRIARLLGALSGATGETYRELMSRRTNLLDQLVEVAARRSDVDRELTQLLAHGTSEEVLSRLDELNPDGLTREQSLEKLTSLDQRIADLITQTEDESRAQDEATHRLSDDHEDVERGTRLMLSGRFDWLAPSGLQAPAADAPILEQAATLTRLRHAAETVREELLHITNDTQALEEALGGLAERLARSSVGFSRDNRRFIAAVTDHYQHRFTQQLAAPEVRRALFEGGTRLRLDLNKMETTWTTPGGERRNRPLEAFSSGERAFAYTRVQLEALGNISAMNKIAFLDEFGAYVARDRLEQLLSFIRRRALQELADQIVVVLPLTSSVTPEQAAQLDSRGYFTRAFHDEDTGISMSITGEAATAG